jgi:chromosome partitioning protein
MAVIVAANEKGGAGKTSMVAALGVALAGEGASVVLVDADPHRNLASIQERGLPLPIFAEADPQAAVNKIKELESKYDFVLVDTAGFTSRTTIYALARADLVIIPIVPALTDMLRAADTVARIREVESTVDREIPFILVLNNVHPLAAVNDAVRENLTDYPVAKTMIPHSTKFREFGFTGTLNLSSGPMQKVSFLVDELVELGLIQRKGAAA